MKHYLLTTLMVIMGISLTSCWPFGGDEETECKADSVQTVVTTCKGRAPDGGESIVTGSFYSLATSSEEEKQTCLTEHDLKDVYNFVVVAGNNKEMKCHSSAESACTAEKDKWVQEKTGQGWSCS